MKKEDAQKNGLLLRGARIVLPGGVTENTSLLIEWDKISRILKSDERGPQEIDTIDLSGATLFPGFIDVHNHGAIGVDTTEADTNDLHRVSRFLARHGVTAWLPTLVPAPVEAYKRATRAIAQLMREQDDNLSEVAARVLGVHYEGPFVNRAQCGALRVEYFRTFTGPTDVDALARVDHNEAAHMITASPETDGGVELVKELSRRGWVISIGHTRADVETLNRACEAGARHMTHFLNAMAPLHHRAPGPIGWGLVRDDVTCDLIADGMHSDPLMLQLVMRCKTSERISLISDSVAPTGLGDGDFEIWGEKIAVVGGRTQNERGSIAGSVITMLDAVRMMKRLGAQDREIAQMAATNPARLLRVDHLCGSIEKGKRADLVAIDGEGRAVLTIIGGQVAHNAGQ